MNQMKSFFTKRRAAAHIENLKRICSESTIDTQDSAYDDYDEVLTLTERISELESEIKARGEEAQLREERLQNVINLHERNLTKLQTELIDSEVEKTFSEQDLIHTKLDQQIEQMNASSRTHEVQESTHTLCNVISSDRLWIEEQMSRRASRDNNI